MPQTAPSIGDLERAALEVLWEEGPAVSVREVHRHLAADRDLAYTTVMTVLDRLAKKGVATRERDGRMWLYSASASREELTAATMRQTLASVPTDDRRGAMLHFLGGASADELDDLRAALDEVERRHGTT